MKIIREMYPALEDSVFLVDELNGLAAIIRFLIPEDTCGFELIFVLCFISSFFASFCPFLSKS